MIAREEFLEYVQILGNYYGTPSCCVEEARENGIDLLIRVDERGTGQLKQRLPNAVSILVLQPSSGKRGPSTGAVATELLLGQRLRDANRMIDPGKFDHVVSDATGEENANRVTAIIRSERS